MTSFEELAIQYEPLIYKILHSLHLYKDLDYHFNIGLLALWEAHLKFDGVTSSFTTFAYSVIKGRLLNELQSSSRWDRIQQLPNVEPHFFNAIHHDSYLEYETILQYCEGLTDNQKKWVIHTYIDDASLDEIANAYRVSKSAVKAWRRDALAQLRKKSILRS